MINQSCLGEIMQFHIDENDPETFVVGRLAALDEKWFLVQSISIYGKWDGLALYLRSDLVSTIGEKRYLEKLSTLIRYHNEPSPDVPSVAEDALQALLGFSRKNGKPVSLELKWSGKCDVCGFIRDIFENTAHIRQIDEYGEYDGETIVDKDAITRVFYGDEELEALGILAQYRNREDCTTVN